MAVVRWSRDRAVAVLDPLTVDGLDGHVLVLEGVSAADDDALGWVRRAPCVVVGVGPPGAPPSAAVDVALGAGDAAGALPALLSRVEAQPQAARVLVDVLRAMPGLDVPTGLTLESLAYSTLLAGPAFARWLAERPAPRPRRFAGPPLRVAREGATLRLTLARPENRNAMSAAMRDALVEALTAAEVDATVEAVVIDGEGPSFCSGGDLAEFGTARDVVRAHEVRTLRSVGAVLHRLAGRATVHVHGPCVGAGVEVAAFAGRVVAAPDATFRLPELGMGLIPGAGGTVSLTRRIGRQATARLVLTGETVDAVTALALGLVDEVRG